MGTSKLTDEKIISLKNKIEDFIQKEDSDIIDLHKIRTSSREVLSLLNEQKLHSQSIKKILKLTNRIRDIDVLVSEYFIKIPTQYKEKINVVFIKDILNKQRQEKLKLFLDYLKIFNIELISLKQNKQFIKPPLSPQKTELHRYRIYIKKQLYISKSNYIYQKMKIK